MIIQSFRLSVVCLGLVCCLTERCGSFTPSSSTRSTADKLGRPRRPVRCLVASVGEKSQDVSGLHLEGRRYALQLLVGPALGLVGGLVVPSTASAEAPDEPALPSVLPQVEMKEFVDPKGLFSIRIPKNFFAIRREVKGDLPDPKTGEGRRGSSIFTAGDMSKAELVAIERFPTRSLLEENGIQATGDLSTFTSLGEPAAIASLLSTRRDRDRTGGRGGMSNTQLVPGSIYLTSDGMELSFQLKSEIEVQKPELLLEQYGVSELYRVTSARASLRSNDGNLMAVYASALESDFAGPDGAILQEAVSSFRVTDRSASSLS